MGCIYASRMCSVLHQSKNEKKIRIEPCFPTIGLFLICTSIFFEAVWCVIVSVVGMGHVDVTFVFSLLYVGATTLQVLLLLLFVRIVSPMLMECHIDPDNFMTPLLTAFADLFGTFILWGVFVLSEERFSGTAVVSGGNETVV